MEAASAKEAAQAAVLDVIGAQPEPRTEDEIVDLYRTQRRGTPGAPELKEGEIRDAVTALRRAKKVKEGDPVSAEDGAARVLIPA